MTTENSPISPRFFQCLFCDYITSHKGDYNKHINTKKHFDNKNNISNNKNSPNLNCENCDKMFKDRAGLWRHKKKCGILNNHSFCEQEFKITEMNKDELIIMLLKQNAELIKGQQDIIKEQQNITMEMVKNGIHNTNNVYNTSTNSHNKAFNLNFFLNETCKNAMNITDFVDSIKLQLTDFMEVGELGYVQGISNIIVKNLNSLDETIRPIHCTDQKRETFYVKDENKWEKEEEDMKKIKKMIQRISYKNERLMNTYKERYPDYKDPQSVRSDQYSKTIIEALGGVGENEEEKHSKIIRNISKATRIKRAC